MSVVPDTPPEAEQALRYAQCRSLGHEWKHRGFVGDNDERRPFGIQAGMVGYRSVCADCKMERIKWVTRSGYLGFTRYYPPPSYSLTGDSKLTNQQWRRTWLVHELGADLDMVAGG